MKKIANWLIVLGIVVFLIPIAGSMYASYEQGVLYQKYLADGSKVQESYELLEQTWQQQPAAEEVPAYNPAVLGRIKIPKINETLLLVEGVTSKDLRVGAGHIPGTAMPGETGNCAIAGHRNYTFGSYFNRLDEVSIGDEITLEYGKKTFVYEVYETLVVLPADNSVIAQIKDDKLLTLVTCTPVRKATHRLIVHAKIVQ